MTTHEFRAYVLYKGDEPIGFAVCSWDQCPDEEHEFIDTKPTQEEAESLAEDAFIDALFEWANEGL